MDFDRFKRQLILHESLKLLPYDDKTGIEIQQGDILHGKITIGIGHNLTDNGITPMISDFIYAEDVAKMVLNVLVLMPWWIALNDVRQRVFVDLAFNMGITGLSKFKNTLSLAKGGDFSRAADALMASLWFKQVGTRGPRLVKMLRTGIDPIELL